MNRKKLTLSFFVIMITLACANITINVYFPAESIQDAADLIIDEVRGDILEQEQQEAAVDETQSKALGGGLWWQTLVETAYVYDIDLNVNTPGIQKIKDSLKKRFVKVNELLKKQVIGESNKGYLMEKDIKTLPLKDMAMARKLIKEENNDRKNLYSALAKANEIPAERVVDIGKIFADRTKKKLLPGQFYQDEKGQWVEQVKQVEK